MSAQAQRPLDDISVEFDEEQTKADGRVIEFSTWCEGEYCEPVRVTPGRARELLASIAMTLRRCGNRTAAPKPLGQTTDSEFTCPLIRIESLFCDSFLVHVGMADYRQIAFEHGAEAGGYTMRFGSRQAALNAAIRECCQWLSLALDHQAFALGVHLSQLSMRFMREARCLVADP
jgi:hypothetical protein